MEQKIMILCDTNIIIELLKGNQSTIKDITSIGLENIAISSITEMELYYGAFNKNELSRIKKALNSLEIIHINIGISNEAVNLIEKYSKSHSLQIPDSIIAATAIVDNFSLYTYNIKDFKYIKKLKLY